MLKLTTLAMVPTLAITAQAQLVTLEDLSGNTVNEQSVTITAGTMDPLMEYDLISTLTGPVGKTVNLKRYELNVVPGSQNYFCWGLCYLPVFSGVKPLWVSQDSVVMSPGVEFNGFHSYYMPGGVADVAGFRFVWFDYFNPDDSTWVDIYFDTEHVGIEELSAPRFDVFPNPAVGGDITIEHGPLGSSGNTELVIYDALGTRCFARSIDAQDTNTRIQAGELPAGIYLATIEDRGRSLASRRVVVASR